MNTQTPAAVQLTHLLHQNADPALGVFLPAGYPTPSKGVDLLHAFVQQGAAVLEVGVPTGSAPLDGPVISAAYEHALRHGARMADVMDTVRHAADSGAPVVVMSYWSPVAEYGVEPFAQGLAEAGAAGAMIPDLPLDQAGPWLAAARTAGIHTPQFAPRDADENLLTRISAAASGWIYAPAVTAATGYRGELDLEALNRFTTRLRAATAQPVVAGIGISTPLRARAVAPYVSGIVMGTPAVRPLLETPGAAGRTRSIGCVRAFAEALHATTAVARPLRDHGHAAHSLPHH
ncbi:tryptophan synthase subunit alpha [Streptomyces sp. NPDC015125]|uniref:tryptophan synthase subunit alpha n=1 Tax=Streptomyces sp. NPDC015125 TaxID=3364938 RepID=UPI0036FC2507